jgi:hypothetical protein
MKVLPRLRLLCGLCALLLYGIGSVWYWNQQAIWEEREAPLDHMVAVLQTPLYALTCPVISDESSDDSNSTIMDEEHVDVDAIDVIATIANNRTTTPTIPFAMISARPAAQVQPVLESWSQQAGAGVPDHIHMKLISTHNFSSTYQNTRCRVQRYSWASQLFAIYQDVFTRLLNDYPDDSYFVTVEDDTVLLNVTRLFQELNWAVRHNVGYYSFTSTSLAAASASSSPSCIYQYGATAQLISRKLMLSIINADDDSFCRLPIDMFIARAGPWYVTTKPITKHIGKRLHISKEHGHGHKQKQKQKDSIAN